MKTKRPRHNLKRRNKLFGGLNNYRFWLAIALLALAILCTVGPLKILLSQDFLVQKLDMDGYRAVILFILAYSLLTVIGIPGTVLTVAGGIVFGIVWGTLWSVVGATLGAVGAFWTARYLLHSYIERKFGKHKALVKLKQAVAKSPLAFVLAVRLVPITPFNLINFLLGLTPIHSIPYSLGTFIGIIPGTFAYTWLGVTGKEALQGGDRLPLYLALSFLALLCVLPICTKKYWS